MDKEEKIKNAIAIAAAFAGWLLITIFIMIGVQQLLTVGLGWNPYPSGTFSFITWLILLIAPPAMIFSYLDKN